MTLSRAQRALLAVFALVGAVDIAVSCYLFYCSTGWGEANPVFAWAVATPPVFVALLVGAKAGGVGLVAAMTLLANRIIDGSGTMVAGTASIMSCGLLALMFAGMAG